MIGRACRGVVIVLAWSAILFASVEARAAVSCSASLDRNRAALGEQLILTVAVEGDVRGIDDPVIPNMGPFDVYGGGQSQRFSFVNGQVHANHSYTYYLRPKQEGRFEIPPITVQVDGKQYATQRIPVTIAGSAASPPPASAPSSGARPRPARPSGQGGNNEDFFVQMTASKDTVVVGQQIVLTFSFYRGVMGSLFDSPQYSPPHTEGFWREDLPPEKHTTVVLQGRTYDVTQIQYALFPTRTGELEIGEAVVRIPEDRFSLFRKRRTSGDLTLRAPAIPITVRALPPGAPSDFRGTVAEELVLRVNTDRQSLAVGEALTLSLTLAGEGYLAAAARPELPEFGPFRAHDSGSSVESRPMGERLQGALTVEKLLIPQEVGDFTLPSIRYSYFDTAQNRYLTLSTRPVSLRVTPSDRAPVSAFASGGKTEIEILGQDILHIRSITAQLRPYGGPLPARPLFWTMVGIPPLLWLASGALARRRKALLSDPQRMRAGRAAREARERLDGDGAEATRVSDALLGYVAAKSGRSAAGLTHDQVEGWMGERDLEVGTTARALALLRRCDEARFAPSAAASGALLDEARSLLDILERQVGRG